MADAVLRSRAGLASQTRGSSFLFLGPTGVGKTELAKALAELLFDDEKNMVSHLLAVVLCVLSAAKWGCRPAQDFLIGAADDQFNTHTVECPLETACQLWQPRVWKGAVKA